MIIGIVGLGLIGGSLAKSIKRNTKHTVWGWNRTESVVIDALKSEAIDDRLTDDRLKKCDIVLVALYPALCVDYIKAHAEDFGEQTIVIDCAGVKRAVCNEIDPLAREYPWTFIGGHPMAGREFSGFASSLESLFDNASMILTPSEDVLEETLEGIKQFFLDAGFKSIRVTTPTAHDEMISYTSQLAHIVSGAYVKNPHSAEHKGFSAGSFRDMTRVARLNEDMWTELFMDNADLLVPSLDDFIMRLTQYRDALRDGDEKYLWELLREGRLMKEALDN